MKMITNSNCILSFNIHSYTDIITNSSSEIFCICNDNTIDHIKKMIDSILKLNNPDSTFDDFFEIKLNYPSFIYNSDVINEILNDIKGEFDKQSFDKIKRKLSDSKYSIRSIDNFICDLKLWNFEYYLDNVIHEYKQSLDNSGYGYDIRYSVIAKDINNQIPAKLIQDLQDLFENYEADY